MPLELLQQISSYLIPIIFTGATIFEFIIFGIKIWEMRRIHELTFGKSIGLVAIFFNFIIMTAASLYLWENEFDATKLEFFLMLGGMSVICFSILIGKLWGFSKFPLHNQ